MCDIGKPLEVVDVELVPEPFELPGPAPAEDEPKELPAPAEDEPDELPVAEPSAAPAAV